MISFRIGSQKILENSYYVMFMVSSIQCEKLLYKYKYSRNEDELDHYMLISGITSYVFAAIIESPF